MFRRQFPSKRPRSSIRRSFPDRRSGMRLLSFIAALEPFLSAARGGWLDRFDLPRRQYIRLLVVCCVKRVCAVWPAARRKSGVNPIIRSRSVWQIGEAIRLPRDQRRMGYASSDLALHQVPRMGRRGWNEVRSSSSIALPPSIPMASTQDRADTLGRGQLRSKRSEQRLRRFTVRPSSTRRRTASGLAGLWAWVSA